MPAAARAQVYESEQPGGKVSVLYAEDQTSARVVTTALLRKLGYDVDAVEDGELALEKAMLKSYDIILLDIEMPVMDGVTAARRIRAESPFCKDKPILAMSAYIADTTENSSWRVLFDCALPKPAKTDEIKCALELALAEGHQAVTPTVATEMPMIECFRSVLPRPMWLRLASQAAEDMTSLALTASACADAADQGELDLSLRALSGMARSFNALSVLATVERFVSDHSDVSGQALVISIANWRDRVSA